MTSTPLFSRIRTVLSGRDGVALLMVLFVVVALTSLVVSITDTTQRHLHLTQYYKNRLQAFWTAQSGIQAAVALLQLDAQLQASYDAYDSAWNCESPAYQENALVFLSVPLCGNSLIDPALTPAVEDPALGVAEPRARCPIEDENRKLSLFPLVERRTQNTESTNDPVFHRLVYLLMYLLKEEDLQGPGALQQTSSVSQTATDPARYTPITFPQAMALAGYVVDWIDTPANTSQTDLNPDRAEETCPEDGLPYEAKNGMMDSVDEIALVCGFRQMPRHVIDELGRNLTVFNLKTNINTATRPVLHAFCAQILDAQTETDSEAIRLRLHPAQDQLPQSVITEDSVASYQSVLGPVVSSNDLIVGLQKDTGIVSDFFRVGINGLVINTSTGSVEANARVTMVVARSGGGQGSLRLFYYREG